MADKQDLHFGEASDQEPTYGKDTPVQAGQNDAADAEVTSNTGDSAGQAQNAAEDGDPAKTPDSYRPRARSTELGLCSGERSGRLVAGASFPRCDGRHRPSG
jgi:hypothetical protein